MQTVQLILTPRQAADEQTIRKAAATFLQLPYDALYGYRIVKRSVDARQRQLKVLLTLQVFLSEQDVALPAYEAPQYQDVRHADHQVLIIGCGPAGLFAALTLLEKGIRPVIIERGKEVSERKRDIALLNRNEGLSLESNYCFGEGGAGTFSDGKLFSRSKKRGNMQRVMELFHYHGADDTVLYEAHPHIGSDKLPRIIRHIRETVLSHGGEIHFSEKMTAPLLEGNRIVGILTEKGNTYHGDAVILAIGHSAHDTYSVLHRSGIRLEAKGFAMGVRVEHPQSLINSLMYHTNVLPEGLENAAYSLVTQVDGRGVYSFCMCPGGHIVPAGSSWESCVVNGMSSSGRNSRFANSGMVVEVHPEDLPAEYRQYGALAGLHFQQDMEHLAYLHGAAPSVAPAQRLTDFVQGRKSGTLPACSYLPGLRSSRLDQWLPPFIVKRLQQGFRDFDRKYRGYLSPEALMVGVESRSSAAVRIPRDSETLQHTDIRSLYPCGEGAGYAGGITSSALDGIRVATAIAVNLLSE